MSDRWKPSSLDEERAKRLVATARKHDEVPQGAGARVWARLERRRWSGGSGRLVFAFGGALAAAAVLVAVGLWLARPKAIGTVVAGGVTRPLIAGEMVRALGERAIVRVPGVLEAVVSDGAEVVLQDPGAPEVLLSSGTALLSVEPRGSRPPLRVRTPRFTVTVVGTVLRVVVDPDRDGSVAVGRGAVVVKAGGIEHRVEAGQRWSSRGADRDDGVSREELSLLGGDHAAGLGAGSFGRAPCSGAAGARMACLLRRADSDDAATAEAALYAAGELALRELGDPGRAVDVWRRQRERFPRGVLGPEARTSIVEALVAGGRNRMALDEAGRYLNEDPRGLKASEMHYLRGAVLSRIDGNCRRARGELDLALQRPTGPWVSRAQSLLASCR
jgi:hypothetical protein